MATPAKLSTQTGHITLTCSHTHPRPRETAVIFVVHMCECILGSSLGQPKAHVSIYWVTVLYCDIVLVDFMVKHLDSFVYSPYCR